MTQDEIRALPTLHVNPCVTFVNRHGAELDAAAARLAAQPVLGFDTETRPAFQKGQSYPPAVLQLGWAEEVVVFQLAPLGGVPRAVADILASAAVVKAGVGVQEDVKGLRRVASNLHVRGFVELTNVAKSVGIKNFGLKGLAAVLMQGQLRKSKKVTTSNWGAPNLTPQQIQYAATDAWAGHAAYVRLAALLPVPPAETDCSEKQSPNTAGRGGRGRGGKPPAFAGDEPPLVFTDGEGVRHTVQMDCGQVVLSSETGGAWLVHAVAFHRQIRTINFSCGGGSWYCELSDSAGAEMLHLEQKLTEMLEKQRKGKGGGRGRGRGRPETDT